ncbi:MAG: hypothetical protein EHM72_05425 [Calditrichaeota bacterium]|nr:MAG: hypothetical protein EHM72_05425 [Calditrichota bacterium]
MRMKKNLLLDMMVLLLPIILFAQGKPYRGPIDPAGDPAMERAGFMNGNRFKMYFTNNTQISDWPRPDASKWPDDYSGTKLLDVAAVLIGAEVYVTQDSIPVTEASEISRLANLGEIDTLVYIQTADYITGNHSVDFNWNRTVEWAFSPVPGYFNMTQDFPAMSNKPDSWPVAWPSTGYETKWPGEWNGRFGRGIMYADMETYFVANDAQDMEKIIQRGDPEEKLITDSPRYYPRPGVRIGDANPDITTQKGFPWGGLGLRVEVRGYQWNNPEARDMIFWEYNIANISDYDLPTCGFGYFIDPSVGGDTGGDGEAASFDKKLDLTYVWDISGKGGGGNIPGVFGMAYLESPGNPNDESDNDEDGLIDEKRDNEAGPIIGATDGIANMENFLSFYNYALDELHPHYAGDEDQDWADGVDANGNGTYAYYDQIADSWFIEPGESSGDDVGLDGVGPGDLNYSGPDEGECNHRPDYILGVGCEPNFAATDVSEADQIGLTSQTIMDNSLFIGNYSNDKDEKVWSLMVSNTFSNFDQSDYLLEFFASTKFPFYRGSEERISVAMLASYDELQGLNNANHSAPTLYKLKKNAQVIYERDYRFSQPPVMPTLKAYPGDGQVTLTWDDRADKYTREPLLSRQNDFEGYKLYRSTDKLFQDAEIITNAQGYRAFKKPIFQCDKIDSILGYAEYGLNEGTAFYLGEDSGLSHHFVDKGVLNGKTYYYAIVAYDYGIEQFGISPTENNIVVELNESEQIIRMGTNVQAVVPGVKAAGYAPPNIAVDQQRSSPLLTRGAIVPEIAVTKQIKPNHTYRVTFGADVKAHLTNSVTARHPMDMQMISNQLFVNDESDQNRLVYSETKDQYPQSNIIHHKNLWEDAEVFDYYAFNAEEIQTDVFDGIQLTLNLPPSLTDTSYLDITNSGWVTGNSAMNIKVGTLASFFPWDYDIIFTDTIAVTGTRSNGTGVRDQDYVSVRKTDLLLNHQYNFYVINKNSIDSTGQYERLDQIVHDVNGNGVYDWQEDVILVGHLVKGRVLRFAGTVFAINFWDVNSEAELPTAGDLYRIKFIRPPSQSDSFVFTVLPENSVNAESLDRMMDRIKVVPNPYIATNSMESAIANPYLNQQRRLMFTHIPADCIIRIFTPTGLLVDEIQVDNEADDGVAHWDMLSKEDLEVAAGMYVYQVKSNVTGKEKIGKFAVIK